MINLKTGKAFSTSKDSLVVENQSRRSFLKGGLAAIIAAGVAPSLCGSITRGLGYRNLAGRLAAMGGKRIPSASGYIQDGLVSIFDGIENDGYDVHNNNLQVWKDLKGGNNCSLFNCTIDSDSVSFNGSTSYGTTVSNTSFKTDAKTFEVVLKNNTSSQWGIIFDPAYKNMIGWYPYNAEGISFIVNSNIPASNPGNCFRTQFHSSSISYSFQIYNVYSSKGYSNNNEMNVLPTKNQFGSNDANFAYIGRRYNGGYYTGSIQCLRIYNRVLSLAEVSENYALDVKRFGIT